MIKINRSLISDFLKFIHPLSAEKEKEEKNLNWFKILWRKSRVWIMLAFGITLFVILLNQISLSQFLEVFSNAKVGYLITAFLVGISATIIKTIRYGFFFPAPGRWLELYGTFGLMRVLYYVLPFKSGELVNLGLLKKFQFSPTIAETAPTWFFLRVTDVIALSFFFSIALWSAPITDILFGKMFSIRWFVFGISASLIVVMLTLPLWIPKVSINISNNWLSNRLNALKSGFHRTSELHAFIRTLIIAIIIWSFLITSYIFAQLTFDTPLELSKCFLVAVTVYCISLLPINTPLNIGTDEAVWTGVMVLAGISTDQAISIAFSIRVISMLVILTDGLIGFSLLFLRNNSFVPA